MHRQDTHPKVTAVLGPTNTGKTFFAIERMLAHKSGMIGLPLRLLAREVYDRIVKLRGPHEVALITGEEKIVPKFPRFYVCTVEAMPLDIPVACLVIDEIQLCADPERGHVFTDRLLHARGTQETMLLGSDTMRGIIQRFVPKTWFVSRARFSDLAYTGPKKLTRLPRRSAVVGFSADDVYGIAEIIRRQRGGAAVVLGALSPRTRNAQVQLYQSADVDFLVATDAIGMGLNMDVDHVAFAARDKFDGARMRPLAPAEIGQIAGRAGRYMNDGTFGVTGDCEPFEDELVQRLETHRYDPVRVLQWRNGALDFRGLAALNESLEAPPPERGLVRARPASDAVALRILSVDEEVAALATSRESVARLWDVCQLPDFRKLSTDEHVKLVRNIFLFLSKDGVIPDDWLARQIARADVVEGDVATLSGRLAQIRTYTYAAHRSGWTRDSAHWQGITGAVEDRLSDALHERLTQRFIDRRTSVLMKHLRDDEFASLALDEAGGVSIGGEAIGKLEGFRFVPDPRAVGIHGRTLRAAALKGLESEIAARSTALAAAEDATITLSEHGKLWWDGAIVARLAPGPSPLAPTIQILADAHVKTEGLQARLDAWMTARITTRLGPLLALRDAAEARTGSTDALPGEARGIAHSLAENFASLDRKTLPLPEKLGPQIRALRRFGVWFGRRTVYLPKLLRPDAAGLLTLLWGVWTKKDAPPAPPAPGLTSFAFDNGNEPAALQAGGFAVIGGRAIRFDMLERLEDELEKALASGNDAEAVHGQVVSLLGSSKDEARSVLAALGWQTIEVAGAKPVWRRAREKQPRRQDRAKPKKPEPPPDPNSPFAGLAALRLR
ncbi:MAG: disulfide oxidoreductase [Alphaproteobacteria bacterium]|nr:disulfide oxidoreductase [Alphaproteobacteria bacterium]